MDIPSGPHVFQGIHIRVGPFLTLLCQLRVGGMWGNWRLGVRRSLGGGWGRGRPWDSRHYARAEPTLRVLGVWRSVAFRGYVRQWILFKRCINVINTHGASQCKHHVNWIHGRAILNVTNTLAYQFCGCRSITRNKYPQGRGINTPKTKHNHMPELVDHLGAKLSNTKGTQKKHSRKEAGNRKGKGKRTEH